MSFLLLLCFHSSVPQHSPTCKILYVTAWIIFCLVCRLDKCLERWLLRYDWVPALPFSSWRPDKLFPQSQRVQILFSYSHFSATCHYHPFVCTCAHVHISAPQTGRKSIIQSLFFCYWNHRITKSQNCRGWKGPLEIIESNPLNEKQLSEIHGDILLWEQYVWVENPPWPE